MTEPHHFHELAGQCELGKVAEKLLDLSRPAVFCFPEESSSTQSFVADYRGAAPAVGGGGMIFLAQIDCGSIKNSFPWLPLPHSGLLRFSTRNSEALWDSPSKGNGRAIFLSDLDCEPPGTVALKALRFEQHFTLHPYEPDPSMIGLPPDGALGNRYFDFRRQINPVGSWLAQIEGFADPLQDVMEPELDALHGRRELSWVLLFCLNATEGGVPFAGRYYFWISEKDLAERKFANAIMLFQA